MALKDRLRKLEQEASQGAVRIHQRDGSVRTFDTMYVQVEMFLAWCDLLRGMSRESEVLEAVRNAVPESRSVFEERFGPIAITCHIISGEEGWVEVLTLNEDGQLEKVRYEDGSPEAEYIRREARGEETSQC